MVVPVPCLGAAFSNFFCLMNSSCSFWIPCVTLALTRWAALLSDLKAETPQSLVVLASCPVLAWICFMSTLLIWGGCRLRAGVFALARVDCSLPCIDEKKPEVLSFGGLN